MIKLNHKYSFQLFLIIGKQLLESHRLQVKQTYLLQIVK